MRYLKWIVPLTLLYIALTANAEPLNWLLGVLLAVGITALLRPELTTVNWRNVPIALWTGVKFVAALQWDLLVSSIQVARIVLQRDMPLRQGIFALPTGSEREAVAVLSAQAITLTPGEMVVEMDDDGTLYVHSLDVVKSAETAPAAQRQRVAYMEKMTT